MGFGQEMGFEGFADALRFSYQDFVQGFGRRFLGFGSGLGPDAESQTFNLNPEWLESTGWVC